jgi:thermitase
LIHLADAQSNYKTTGGGVVAVIDTGVDPAQPVLKSVLVPGYDFVNNKTSVDETADINQSTMAVLDNNNAQPGFVNQSTMAVLDQSTMAVLDGPQYAAFGHGTMVSGVIHLVAPTAQIMPLKAFTAAGTGNLSDVVRAIYFASFHGAKVINMSFDFSSSSTELKFALNTANLLGVICVASSGNDGKQISVYPASYSNVIGAASTSNIDQRSTFSNYGSQVVWVAAPGEGVVTTYPFGSYAAVWGTSFSAPMVSGTAALLVGLSHGVAQQNTAASSLAHADYINSQLNHGRLNVNTAVDSWLLYIGPK